MADKALIDGRLVSRPVIDEHKRDTSFTVEGLSPWGSESKYNVHYTPEGRYYEYKELQSVGKDWEGNDMKQKVTVRGNDPERLKRYDLYFRNLKDADFWPWWKRMFKDQPNIQPSEVEEKQTGGPLEETYYGTGNVLNAGYGTAGTAIRGAGQMFGAASEGLSTLLSAGLTGLAAPFQLLSLGVDAARKRVSAMKTGGRLMRVGGKIIEVSKTKN